ncbi:MAG: Veg family protein [Candidatus Paralactobacillus gallistercoris]|uniref:Veg family protein n=1 Tax=Candidatus Paralactobacillus gallistercoris TaxID=2838724 RepID=A0A948TIV0_9LACO|nr:Veg family protein [Candidatus Paralactobacillus gallistercoris]
MPVTLVQIKKYLDQHIGQHLQIMVQAGRKRIIKHNGVLTKTYPAIFTVELDHDHDAYARRVSYNYTDLLTQTVDLQFDDESN